MLYEKPQLSSDGRRDVQNLTHFFLQCRLIYFHTLNKISQSFHWLCTQWALDCSQLEARFDVIIKIAYNVFYAIITVAWFRFF